MSSIAFDNWLNLKPLSAKTPRFVLCTEKPGARAAIMKSVVEAIHDHLIGLNIVSIWRVSHPRCVELIGNKLPTKKRVRSGDFGEILATEWVPLKTKFKVPVKRLQYKDDRDMPMRGDDLVGYHGAINTGIRVLKLEAKSKANLSADTVHKAANALLRHSARPNPSTLAFIGARLREQKRDDEALIFEHLQTSGIPDSAVEHMIFLVSGNDPEGAASQHLDSPLDSPINRHVVAIQVTDHQSFIAEAFKLAYA